MNDNVSTDVTISKSKWFSIVSNCFVLSDDPSVEHKNT
jgi:hypothetical protein